MRRIYASLIPVAALISLGCTSNPQTESPPSTTQAVSSAGAEAPMDASRVVAGGGISAAGWSGQIDAAEAKRGQALSNAKLVSSGNTLLLRPGPRVANWIPRTGA